MAGISLAEKVLPKEFRDELDRILDSKGRRTKKDSRNASVLTRLDRRNSLRRIFATLWELGYKLRSPQGLREKHVQTFVSHLIDEGKGAASIQGDLSALRQFADWIGKGGMIGETMKYARNDADRERLARTYVATVSKAWEANGVDADDMIARAIVRSERVALYIALMRDFGLRLREAICLKPIRDLQMDGKFLSVRDGTKGGRPRMVPVTNDAQRRTLDWAMRIADKRGGRITPPGYTLDRAYSHARTHITALGLTRSGLGVTPHGLRHAYAQSAYEEIAKRKSPIAGGDPKQIDFEKHQATCYEVMERLGHGRIDVGGNYYGSYGHKLRRPSRVLWWPLAGDGARAADADAGVPQAGVVEGARHATPETPAHAVQVKPVLPNYGASNVIPIMRMVVRQSRESGNGLLPI